MNYIGTFSIPNRHRHFLYDDKYIYYYTSTSDGYNIGDHVYYGKSLLSDILENKKLHDFYNYNVVKTRRIFNFEVGDIIAVDNDEEACHIVIGLLTKIIFDKL